MTDYNNTEKTILDEIANVYDKLCSIETALATTDISTCNYPYNASCCLDSAINDLMKSRKALKDAAREISFLNSLL